MVVGRLATVIAVPASLGCVGWSETGGVGVLSHLLVLVLSRAADSRNT